MALSLTRTGPSVGATAYPAKTEAGGRCPLTPNPSKVTGDPFPVDRNSKTRTAGQLRVEDGSCPNYVFLILEIRRHAV